MANLRGYLYQYYKIMEHLLNSAQGTPWLVHISEVADSNVKDANDFLKEKDKAKVKVINVKMKGKIGLSISQAKEKTKANYQL